VLAKAVGDHLPYEPALRVAALAAQLTRRRQRARRPRARGGGGALSEDLEARAPAVAVAAAAPNTRRAYATAYRAFTPFLRDRCDDASPQNADIRRGHGVA
jgi:hypothetical protein